MTTTALVSLTSKLAAKFGMTNEIGLMDVLKQTAFKGQVSDSQMTALMIVANQYGLNPFTKEIFAFPDKNNGIVPVVGVDGWSRIINENAQFDGMDFESDPEQCTCIIYRKDRSHPIKVTEYMSECRRAVGPWQSHPRRMLRHKAMIQCARLAFGYVGIYEQDEAERIIESTGTATVIDGSTGEILNAPATPKLYPADQFASNLPAWKKLIADGKQTAEQIIAKVQTKGALTDQQKELIKATKLTPIDGEFIPAEEGVAA